jgi:mycothiol S-conjugate amidase
MWSRARLTAHHEKFQELELESPYNDDWFKRPSLDHRVTTKVEIGEYYGARREALLAHATQVDPEEKFWFGLPDDAAAEAYPYEDYILAKSLVDAPVPEDDLFAGLSAADTEAA